MQELSGGSVLANLLTGLGIDERFTRTEGGTTSTFLTDLLGSTVSLTNNSGIIQTSYGYDAYGVATSSGSSNGNPYQFTGRNNDGTGLFYYRARYYNPTWGKFISEDPLGLTGGSNLYAYVDSNPIALVDPIGLAATPNPNGVVPGGPWTPAGPGQRSGTFYDPKKPSGGRTQCNWVPPETEGGPPGSAGYRKTRSPAGSEQRYNRAGVPISVAEAHHQDELKSQPPSNPLSPALRFGTGVGIFLGVVLYSTPAY